MTEYKIKLPLGQGHLIGNMIRQFSVRGKCSWQIVGYKIDKHGLMCKGKPFTHPSLLRIKSDMTKFNQITGATDGQLRTLTLSREGNYFCANGALVGPIEGLEEDTLDVLIYYGSGARSGTDNMLLIDRMIPGSSGQYVAVSSKHNSSKSVSYTVDRNLKYETLIISGDLDELRSNVVEIISAMETVYNSLTVELEVV